MPLFAIIGAALFGGLLIGSSRRPRYRERHAHAINDRRSERAAALRHQARHNRAARKSKSQT